MHEPCWLVGSWTEYIKRAYVLDPKCITDMLTDMTISGKTLGQEVGEYRGGERKAVGARPLLEKKIKLQVS